MDPNPTQPTRHSIFYIPEDTTVFLLTQSNIYIRVSGRQFGRRSKVVDNMLHIPQKRPQTDIEMAEDAESTQVTLPPEGSCDENPIKLPYGTIEEHEDFLPLIFPQSIEDTGPLSYRPPGQLLNILRLAKYYEMDQEVQLCEAALGAHPQFDPAHKLYSSLETKLTDWRRPAISSLLNVGIQNLSVEQQQWLLRFHLDGLPFFCALAQLAARIKAHRVEVALVGMNTSAATGCMHHHRCKTNWRITWTEGFLPHYLHPTAPCTESEARDMLMNVRIADMSDACYSRMLRNLLEAEHAPLTLEDKWTDNLAERMEFAVVV